MPNERKKFYQEIINTSSNGVLLSGDIAEAPSIKNILRELSDFIVGQHRSGSDLEQSRRPLEAFSCDHVEQSQLVSIHFLMITIMYSLPSREKDHSK